MFAVTATCRSDPRELIFPGSLRQTARREAAGGLGDFSLLPLRPSHISRPESRQGYPPNLSILISGGKENNSDAPSNGE